jgi:hypothetical protein
MQTAFEEPPMAFLLPPIRDPHDRSIGVGGSGRGRSGAGGGAGGVWGVPGSGSIGVGGSTGGVASASAFARELM